MSTQPVEVVNIPGDHFTMIDETICDIKNFAQLVSTAIVSQNETGEQYHKPNDLLQEQLFCKM